MGEVAVHAVLLALGGVLALTSALGALILTVVVLISLLLESRLGAVFGALYPRQRAYNLLHRRGQGRRRVVAFAFVDRPRSADRYTYRLRGLVAALGAGVSAAYGVQLAGWTPALELALAVPVALGLVSLVLLAVARSERTEPADERGLDRLLELLEAEPPPDTELVLVAMSGGAPRLDGLAALVDQNAHRWGVFVPFFGRLAATPRGAALFASRRAVPIFLGLVVREPGWGQRYRVVFRRLECPRTGELEADTLTLLTRYHSALEDTIRSDPEQYFWQHKRWKTRPSEEQPERGEVRIPENETSP